LGGQKGVKKGGEGGHLVMGKTAFSYTWFSIFFGSNLGGGGVLLVVLGGQKGSNLGCFGLLGVEFGRFGVIWGQIWSIWSLFSLFGSNFIVYSYNFNESGSIYRYYL